MNCCGKQSPSVLQLHDRHAAAALVRRAAVKLRDERVLLRNPASARFNWPVP